MVLSLVGLHRFGTLGLGAVEFLMLTGISSNIRSKTLGTTNTL